MNSPYLNPRFWTIYSLLHPWWLRGLYVTIESVWFIRWMFHVETQDENHDLVLFWIVPHITLSEGRVLWINAVNEWKGAGSGGGCPLFCRSIVSRISPLQPICAYLPLWHPLLQGSLFHGLFLLLDNSASMQFSSLFLSLILCCHKLRSELGILWKRIWPLLDGLAAKIIMSILNLWGCVMISRWLHNTNHFSK